MVSSTRQRMTTSSTSSTTWMSRAWARLRWTSSDTSCTLTMTLRRSPVQIVTAWTSRWMDPPPGAVSSSWRERGSCRVIGGPEEVGHVGGERGHDQIGPVGDGARAVRVLRRVRGGSLTMTPGLVEDGDQPVVGERARGRPGPAPPRRRAATRRGCGTRARWRGGPARPRPGAWMSWNSERIPGSSGSSSAFQAVSWNQRQVPSRCCRRMRTVWDCSGVASTSSHVPASRCEVLRVDQPVRSGGPPGRRAAGRAGRRRWACRR